MRKSTFRLKDYRDINYKYNSIASIEMIEAVGQNYLAGYFSTLKNNLSSNGTAAIQAITIDDSFFKDIKINRILFRNIFFQEDFFQIKIVLINIFLKMI